ncbi:MAG: DUF421 domain-containing protein [Cellulosilyticaceae bacterium]
MHIPFLLKPIILFIVAVFLIRLTGRRSLAEMTIAQTVMIISIGAIIVEPFADKDVKKTIITATIFIILLILFELLAFYFKFFKKLAVGEPIVIIRQGIFDDKNLRKLRLTKEEVLAKLRQEGIPKLDYIAEGTMESNGEFGYKLTKEAEPMRVGDMIQLLSSVLGEEEKRKLATALKDLKKIDE